MPDAQQTSPVMDCVTPIGRSRTETESVAEVPQPDLKHNAIDKNTGTDSVAAENEGAGATSQVPPPQADDHAQTSARLADNPDAASPKPPAGDSAKTQTGTNDDTKAEPERNIALEDRFLTLIDKFASRTDSLGTSTFRVREGDVFARVVSLVRKLAEPNDKNALFREAYLATALLQSNSANAPTVSAILDDIDFSTSRNSPIYTVMRGLWISVITLLVGGLVVLLAAFLSLSWAYRDDVTGLARAFVANILTQPLLISTTFGILGSAVSILLRLSEFEGARKSRQFLLMTGATLPFVGAVFACVTCALFASGIINFNFASGNVETGVKPITNSYFFIVIGFLSGFSERFTRGLLGTAEQRFTAERTRETEKSVTDLSGNEAKNVNRVSEKRTVDLK